jgi:hypothetical protein
MMALTDASRHDWLEGRGPEFTLIGFQDDATGQILAAHFQLEAENTLGYLRTLRTMIATHGIPLSLYRDRHSIFQRNDSHWTLAEQLAGKQAPTQLGRALDQLGIEQIPAYSPQAKGRIERAWRTCQDRLVSELRLAQATTLSQANAVLDQFCTDYNQRFARPAADVACDFRSLPRRFDLARCLSLHYQRVVASRSHRHLGRACRLPAALVRSSWLCWRNRRAIAPARRLRCASIAGTPYCWRYLCRSKNTPNAALSPSPRRRKEKPLASTTSPAALLWRPLLKR